MDSERSNVADLNSQLHTLSNRVKELEIQNAKLSSLLSNCRCHKNGETVYANGVIEEMGKLEVGKGDGTRKKKSKKRPPGGDTRTMSHPSKRYVALKVMYFGQRFYGFASEAQMDPTVESEIFKALEKTRLIFGNKTDFQYSRCGRTDKGVSSVGQVIALLIRSNRKDGGESVSEEPYEELDYVKILNRVLPKDIRVIGWCPAPINFSARFSCLSREYKYFFWRENLDILAMETAGKKLVGEHDFRNFCKMDAANVHNYRRHITLFEICPGNESFEGDQLLAMKIKGSAFLWHQVRCMVAVLFLVGQGFESPNVIDALLDIATTQRKPQYTMAPEVPLVLQSCEFECLKFICSSDARRALQLHFEKECRAYKLQAAIFHEALQSSSLIENDDSALSYGMKKKVASHYPLMSRLTEPSYEERRTKLNAGAQK